jgi:hypothetical protein
MILYQYCIFFVKNLQYWNNFFIPVLSTILVYQYCDRQVQEIRLSLRQKEHIRGNF